MGNAYLTGRVFAYDHPDALPPCSNWLFERYGFDACDRQLFMIGFAFTRALQPFSGPIDIELRECRCRNGCSHLEREL